MCLDNIFREAFYVLVVVFFGCNKGIYLANDFPNSSLNQKSGTIVSTSTVVADSGSGTPQSIQDPTPAETSYPLDIVTEVHNFPASGQITLAIGENYIFGGCQDLIAQIDPVGLEGRKGPQVGSNIQLECVVPKIPNKPHFQCNGIKANVERRGNSIYWVICR
jgi:hypothetical protein